MFKAYLIGDRVIVLDDDTAKKLYFDGFYGNPLHTQKPKKIEDVKAPLVLSPLETLFLVEKEKLKVYDLKGNELSFEELLKVWKDVPRLMEKYIVYKELRERGFVVRSGLKYGADFSAYEFGPGIDHAPYVVDVVTSDEEIESTKLIKAGRVAHGVRKKFIMAVVKDKTTRYVMFKWYLP